MRPSRTALAQYVILLRSVYIALERDHEAPKVIDEFTTVMGHLQDDLKAGNPRLARKEADELRDLMRKKELNKITEELDDFHGASGKPFRKWIQGEADQIRELIGADESKKSRPRNSMKFAK